MTESRAFRPLTNRLGLRPKGATNGLCPGLELTIKELRKIAKRVWREMRQS